MRVIIIIIASDFDYAVICLIPVASKDQPKP